MLWYPCHGGIIVDNLIIRRRNLPHWELRGATYFITFRLFKAVADVPLTVEERTYVKRIVLSMHDALWHVHVLTIMPDHAHILATPCEQSLGKWYPLPVILRRIKGRTAREINLQRGRMGPFWQKESFDRIVRDDHEYDEKAQYILNNAVKAGISADSWTYDGFWCESDAETPG